MLARVRAHAGRGRGGRRDLHAGQRSCDAHAQTPDERRRSRVRRLRGARALRAPSPPVARALRRRAPTKSRSTKPPRERANLKLGEQMLVARLARRAKRYTIVGIVKFGGGASFGGAGVGAAHAPRGPARRRRAGPLRPDRRRGAAPGVTPGAAARRLRAVLPRDGRGAHRRRSRPATRPRNSKATSASSGRSCSCSPTSRCSSARSSSSTRSRSRSPSARASSGCCARSAPRARRSCARSSTKACCSGSSARCSGCSSGSCSRPALDQLFKAFGADLPDSGTVLETRTIVVSLLVGIGRDRARRAAPALRATRVPPLAAMREGVGDPAAHAAARAALR